MRVSVRFGSVAVSVLLLGAGCGTDSDERSDTGSGDESVAAGSVPVNQTDLTAVESTVPAPQGRPDDWYGVSREGDKWVVYHGSISTGEVEVMGRQTTDAGAPETSLPVDVEDLAVDWGRGRVYVADCCEPASGAITPYKIGEDGSYVPSDEGSGGRNPGRVVAVNQATGEVMRADGPDGGVSGELAGRFWRVGGLSAVDVAWWDGSLVVVSDPGRFDADGSDGEGGELLSGRPAEDGAYGLVGRVSLGGESYCRVVVAGGVVYAQRGVYEPDGGTCISDRLVGFEFSESDELVERGEVVLAEAVRDIEADASGRYVLVTTDSGGLGYLDAGDLSAEPTPIALPSGVDMFVAGW